MRYGRANGVAIVAAWLAFTATVTSTQSAVKQVSRTPQRAHAVRTGLSAAEDQFVRKFANEFSQTLAVVATNPEATYPQGTLADRIRDEYMKMDPARRKALRPASLKLVPMTGAARPTAMGRVGAQDVSAVRAQAVGLSPALRTEFRTLIDKRLDGARAFLDPLTRSMARRAVRPARTWVEGGIFGEGDAGGKQEITLNEPVELGFRWGTEEAGAVAGYWELRSRATGLVDERVIATGITVDDTRKAGIQGFFEINFAKYLAPKPPVKGEWTYYVRVKPIPRQRPEAQKAPGGRGTIGPAPTGPQLKNAGPPKEPEGVGPWSGPVVIHYGASTAPPQRFDEHYRAVQFYLDKIDLVEDQSGSGDEEFWIAGFIQSGSPGGVGNQYKLGPHTATLNPPAQVAFGQRVSFQLPPGGDFPRTYTVVLSIIEKDPVNLVDPSKASEALQDWLESVWKIARGMLSAEVDRAIRERLSDLQQQMAQDVAAEARAAALEALKEAATNDFYSAWLKMVITIIVGAIEGSLPHDYYGTEMITFVMPTNRVDFVQNQLAFWVLHRSSSPQLVLPPEAQSLTGQLQNGLFRVQDKVVQFFGQPSYPSAGSFDGKVNITMHWVFSGRGL